MVANSIKPLKTVHIKKKTLYLSVYDALLDMERCSQCIEREMQSTMFLCDKCVYIYL